jgi:iron complex transport system permease protein
MMQVLLRNPLADPYVLGVSGGSAAFALIVMLLGFPFSAVPIAATMGAGFSIVLLIILARNSGDWGSSRLLLTGIVLASGWGALIGFFLSLGEANQIQGMLFWLMGDLRPEWPGFIRVLVLLAVLIAGFIVARDLDLLLEGDLRARSLGLNTSALRLIILLAASLLTAASVTLAGPVGFIGLVVPHMMRLIIGSRHRLLIPVSALAGGTLLVIAEMIARTVIAPQQLPVGVITSFIGVPVFLYLLRRRGLSIPS